VEQSGIKVRLVCMAGAPEMSQFGNNVAEKHHTRWAAKR
jgi:hypothetical protein